MLSELFTEVIDSVTAVLASLEVWLVWFFSGVLQTLGIFNL